MQVREAWYSKFLAAGVSRERVELLPFADYVVGEINTHLASYSRIDIALDSLPAEPLLLSRLPSWAFPSLR